MTQVDERVKKLSAANLDFALDLYRLVADGKDDNVFFSPASINIALAMVRAGAKHATHDQLTKGLHLHQHLCKEDEINCAYSTIIEALNEQNEELALRTANRMYVQEKYHILEEFKKSLMKTFKTETGTVDFVNNPKTACEEINEWVEEFTNDKIKNIIYPEMLSPDTKLVLINAVYFKGIWVNQFEEGDTTEMDFQATPSRKIKVEMMAQKEEFKYAESSDLDCKVLSLPYNLSSLRMMILLPNKVDGLDNLISKLNSQAFETLTDSLRTAEVSVKLPKFKMETNYHLNEILQNMGITHIFERNEADLSGINGTKQDLFVYAVIHKTFLEVNERGTEAAAATACDVADGMPPQRPHPKQFIADHPFLFFIVDRKTGIAVFMGSLRNPSPVPETHTTYCISRRVDVLLESRVE